MTTHDSLALFRIDTSEHPLLFRSLPHDSKRFGLPCYILADESEVAETNSVTAPAMLYAKVAASKDVSSHLELTDAGFVFLDTELDLTVKGCDARVENNSGYVFSHDPKLAVDIPASLFASLYCRFHLDPEIPDTIADSFWQTYCQDKIFAGTHKVFFAINHGQIVGVILYEVRGDSIEIDLLSVGETHQRMRLGSTLVASALAQEKVSAFTTQTYAGNHAALQFYMGLGHGTVTGASHVFHCWLKPETPKESLS